MRRQCSSWVVLALVVSSLPTRANAIQLANDWLLRPGSYRAKIVVSQGRKSITIPIHLRRPDGRDLDYVLHVNPGLKGKGLLMVYNPTSREITRPLRLPLCFTGADGEVRIREQEGKPEVFPLNRSYEVELGATVPAHAFTWFVIE